MWRYYTRSLFALFVSLWPLINDCGSIITWFKCKFGAQITCAIMRLFIGCKYYSCELQLFWHRYMLEYYKQPKTRQTKKKQPKIMLQIRDHLRPMIELFWFHLIFYSDMLCSTDLRFFQINTWAGQYLFRVPFFRYFPVHFLRSPRNEKHICRWNLWKKSVRARTMFLAKSPIGVFAFLRALPSWKSLIAHIICITESIIDVCSCCLRLCFACLAIC